MAILNQEKLWTPLMLEKPYREIWIDQRTVWNLMRASAGFCTWDQVILVMCSPSWSSPGIGLVSSTAGEVEVPPTSDRLPSCRLALGCDFRHASSSVTCLMIWTLGPSWPHSLRYSGMCAALPDLLSSSSPSCMQQTALAILWHLPRRCLYPYMYNYIQPLVLFHVSKRLMFSFSSHDNSWLSLFPPFRRDGNCTFCSSLGTKFQLFSAQSASWSCSWSTSLGTKRISNIISFLSPSLGWWTNWKKRKHMNQWLVNLPFAVLQRVGCSHPGLWQLSSGLFFICASIRSSVIPALMGIRDGRQLWGRTSQGEPIMSILQFALISHSQLYNRALMLLVAGHMWGLVPTISLELTPNRWKHAAPWELFQASPTCSHPKSWELLSQGRTDQYTGLHWSGKQYVWRF